MQEDLYRLDVYCVENQLELNPSKCSSITYTRKKYPILFDYSLKNQILLKVDEVRDLGVLHDSKLIFDKHIAFIVKKASKSLGFIMRMSKDFKQAKTIKILFSSYVRPHLEYASQIWNPRYDIYIKRIESVQKKFIRYLNYCTNSNFCDYNMSCQKHHFLKLEKRRQIADILFLTRIVTSTSLDCPELLHKLNIYCPSHSLRSAPFFSTNRAATNYRQNSFLYRSCQSFNQIMRSNDIDIFNTSIPSLRNRLISINL